MPQEYARELMRRWREREEVLGPMAADDAAWHILLALFCVAKEDQTMTVAEVRLATRLAPTTVHRWLLAMAREGVLIRTKSNHDLRRTYVELAPGTQSAIEHLLHTWAQRDRELDGAELDQKLSMQTDEKPDLSANEHMRRAGDYRTRAADPSNAGNLAAMLLLLAEEHEEQALRRREHQVFDLHRKQTFGGEPLKRLGRTVADAPL